MTDVDVGRAWLDKAYQYADDVKAGIVPACKFVRLAVDRWFDDIENAHKRGLYFSEYHAARYFRFVGRYCRHYQGDLEGKLLTLEPWQCFIDANLFGWIREDGTRRFRMAYEECGRKNGKTTRIAAAGNFYLIGDNEGGAQVYAAATKKEQAREIFDSAKAMIEQSPQLLRVTDPQEHKILHKRSKFLPLSRDNKKMDGFNVHAGLVDELHAHPNSGIWDVLRSAMGARKQPVLRAITTAGFDHNSYCYSRRQYTIQVLERSIEDDTFFGIIYTLDDEKKWDDESEWIKANPNLGVSVDLDDLRAQCAEAKHIATSKVEFLTKRLNIWVYGEQAWMNMEAWAACKTDFDSIELWDEDADTELDGDECYGGLDLASVEDMCSFSLCFPHSGGKRRVIQRAYLPQAALERRLKKGDKTLEQYKDSGHLIVTPGAVVDYDWIKKDILQACDRFDVQGIAFDRWNSSQLVTDLTEQGIPMVKFGQGFASMSAPTKELLRLVLTGQIEHNDPLLTWAISNVVTETNAAGDIKPDKSKVSEKIDPAVAAIMAIALAMGVDETDDQDFLEL
ncbi:terminase large subunit [Gilvimarinus agarilyticus]|uniref:terminase large subunit n=1 Tax=Gilvimarinus agarilyticus TaxID=679259 RepID=UPI000696BAA8|nr:terminase TerL endonuclease subunit [Gilvimarinus agarilyticus]